MAGPPEIEPWRNPVVVETFARRHYQGGLEFHNYPHAVLTADIAEMLAAVAVRNGADIDSSVLRPAGLYHDAGIAMWAPYAAAFPTRESYAADLARKDLRMLNMREPQLSLTGEAIQGTNYMADCANDTVRCVRQADLIAGGVIAHPVVFLNGTYRLYLESKRLQDESPVTLADPDKLTEDLIRFGDLSHEVMLAYLEHDIALGPHQRNEKDESLFNIRAAENVALLEPDNLRRILGANLGYIVEYQPLSIVPASRAAS